MTPRKLHGFRRRAIPVVMALLTFLSAGVAPSAFALPSGGTIVEGDGAMRYDGAELEIRQFSEWLGMDWHSFSIGAGEAVVFVQPGADSVALNRVLGPDPSEILGRLHANGQVFLVNPQGVLFGPDARVDVGGIVASALALRAVDVDAGTVEFGGDPGGRVVNLGEIVARDGGYIAFIGAQADNAGWALAPLGTVAFGAGERVTIGLDGSDLVSLSVDEAALGALLNISGVIAADGGLVLLDARAQDALQDAVLNVDGIVRARSLVNRDGVIAISGGDAGVVNVDGVLDASGGDAARDRGGRIQVTGEYIALDGEARVDASGASGGEILIGGGFQGADPAAQNARAVFVGEAVVIDASATGSQPGDGGDVIVWSDAVTRFLGEIRATGSQSGGDGGFAEVSSAGHLDYRGLTDLRARRGADGVLLLDPTDITIADDPDIDVAWDGDQFAPNGDPDSSVLSVSTLLDQLALSDVIVSTRSGGGGAGDIALAPGTQVHYAGNDERSLILRADRSISFGNDASITSATAPLHVILNARAFGSATGQISLADGSRIVTEGGDIVLGGGEQDGRGRPDGFAVGTDAANANGVMLGTGVVLDAGAGDISVRGRAFGDPSENGLAGVFARENAWQTTSGHITVEGVAGGGEDWNVGVHWTGSMVSQSGDIAVVGVGDGNGFHNHGIYVGEGEIRTGGHGRLSLTGRTDAAIAMENFGVVFDSARVTAGSGDVVVTADRLTSEVDVDGVPYGGDAILEGQGGLYFSPLFSSTSIGIAGGDGEWQLDAGVLGFIQPGFSKVVIGREDGTGKITVGTRAPVFENNLVLRNAGMGSDGIRLAGRIEMAPGKWLALSSVGDVQQIGSLIADELILEGDHGEFDLTSPDNHIGRLRSASVHSLSLSNASDLIVGGPGADDVISVAGDLSLAIFGNGADLIVENSVINRGGGLSDLALEADRSVIVSGGARLGMAEDALGSVNVFIHGNSFGSGLGNAQLHAGTRVVTNGGNLIISGVGRAADTASERAGVFVQGASLDAGDGVIELLGEGFQGNAASAGIHVEDSEFRTTSGNVTLAGASGDTDESGNVGVFLSRTTIASDTGNIMLSGFGLGEGGNNYGALVDRVAISTAGDGFVIIEGIADSGVGVKMTSSDLDWDASFIATVDGDIFVSGAGAVGIETERDDAFGDQKGMVWRAAGSGSVMAMADATSHVGMDLRHAIEVLDGDVDLIAGGDEADLRFGGSILSRNDDGYPRILLFADRSVVLSENVRIGMAEGASGKVKVLVDGGLGSKDLGNVQMLDGARIVTNGGDAFLQGLGIAGGSAAERSGVYLRGATVDTGAGNLFLTGLGATGGFGASGVHIEAGASGRSTLTTMSGNVTIEGIGYAGAASGAGVRLEGGLVQSLSGSIMLLGDAIGAGDHFHGVQLGDGAVVEVGGDINIVGFNEAEGQHNHGIYLSSSVEATTPRIASVAGHIIMGGHSEHGQGIVMHRGDIAAEAGILALVSDGVVAQSEEFSLSTVNLLVMGDGAFDLSAGTNRVTTVAGEAGRLALGVAGDLTIGEIPGVEELRVQDTVFIRAGGDLRISAPIQAEGDGDAIVLVADGNLIIDDAVGGAPLKISDEARFLIYAADPALSSLGQFSSPGNLFGRAFDEDGPESIAKEFGSRVIYAAVPTLYVSADEIRRTYGEANGPLTWTLTSGLIDGDSEASALTGALHAAIDERAGAGVHAGAVERGTLSSPLGYNILFTAGDIVVERRQLTVTADPKTKTYGDEDPEFTFVVGGKGYALDDDEETVFTGALGRVAGESVSGGPYAITIGSLKANDNYAVTFHGANLTISPAIITIRAEDAVRNFGGLNPAFTAAYEGLKFDHDASIFDGNLEFHTDATRESEPGTYALTPFGIVVSEDLAANYELRFVSGVLTVLPESEPRVPGAPTGAYKASINDVYRWLAWGASVSQPEVPAFDASVGDDEAQEALVD